MSTGVAGGWAGDTAVVTVEGRFRARGGATGAEEGRAGLAEQEGMLIEETAGRAKLDGGGVGAETSQPARIEETAGRARFDGGMGAEASQPARKCGWPDCKEFRGASCERLAPCATCPGSGWSMKARGWGGGCCRMCISSCSC